ncbi:DUF2934 domain-containing protein [Pseudomonas sp. Marseille-QA0892]
MADEERTRERAYAIWESEGRPEGKHDDHWAQAQDEYREDSGSDGLTGGIESSVAPPMPKPGSGRKPGDE